MKKSELIQIIREEIASVEYQKLEQLLKHHDWHYSSSDDDKVYDRGAAQEKAYINIMGHVSLEKSKSLFLKYCPFPRKEQIWKTVEKQAYK